MWFVYISRLESTISSLVLLLALKVIGKAWIRDFEKLMKPFLITTAECTVALLLG